MGTIDIDAQDAQDFSGNDCLVIPGIRKSAANHRMSWLSVLEALVLLILYILYIDVYKTKKAARALALTALRTSKTAGI